MSNYTEFRKLREELLKVLHGLRELDHVLKEKPTKRLNLGQWEDVRVADVYLRIFPSLLSYVDKEDRSQFESLERYQYQMRVLANRVQWILLKRSDTPDLELHDKLDRFATNNYYE